MALDFTLLEVDQIVGGDKLDVMAKWGSRAAPTDLAALLGSEMSSTDKCLNYRTCEGDLACYGYWSKSLDRYGHVLYRHASGDQRVAYQGDRDIAARPALTPEETKKLQPTNRKTGAEGVKIVEYGEYPQTVADKKTAQKLEKLFESTSIRTTGKKYTFSSDGPNVHEDFKAKSYPEYTMEGKKYIRIPGHPADDDSKLSTGEQIKEGKPYWVRVEPIEWLEDPSGYWVSKKCLFAGVPFGAEDYSDDFPKTFIKHYLDTYFAKEVKPSELVADKRIIKGLNERLSEISDLEKVKATVTPARTPERTEALARIMRVRKAKALLSAAAQKAHKEGDKKTLQEIVEMAKPYAAREAAVLNKFHLKRAERRAARAKKDRE